MQDVITQYDGTIRDGTDIVQFCYGIALAFEEYISISIHISNGHHA